MRKPLFVATGAFDTGKTATLDHLSERYGIRVYDEVYLEVLRELGERTLGHPADRPFERLESAAHFCPLCRPGPFRDRVLRKQQALEARCPPYALLERGYVDPWEMFTRNTGAPPRIPVHEKARYADYATVFLFEVMPELQRPRWGKPAARRVEEALRITHRLRRLYREQGFAVLAVPPGTIADRAVLIAESIQDPRSGGATPR